MRARPQQNSHTSMYFEQWEPVVLHLPADRESGPCTQKKQSIAMWLDSSGTEQTPSVKRRASVLEIKSHNLPSIRNIV